MDEQVAAAAAEMGNFMRHLDTVSTPRRQRDAAIASIHYLFTESAASHSQPTAFKRNGCVFQAAVSRHFLHRVGRVVTNGATQRSLTVYIYTDVAGDSVYFSSKHWACHVEMQSSGELKLSSSLLA